MEGEDDVNGGHPVLKVKPGDGVKDSTEIISDACTYIDTLRRHFKTSSSQRILARSGYTNCAGVDPKMMSNVTLAHVTQGQVPQAQVIQGQVDRPPKDS